MLYKLSDVSGKKSLKALPFLDYGDLQKLEKDLEILIKENLFEVLFEDKVLMPIFQERPFQSEADLYALNQYGDLVIFELKRSEASVDAMIQILWYAQQAGQWTYDQLNEKYQTYSSAKGNEGKSLQEAHQDAFQLERPLLPYQFNTKQDLLIIGSAADDKLINAVDYWKKQGLSVNFVPYRVYKLGDEVYFEFFSPPYDRHRNPSSVKGVLFDTNRSYDEDAVWEMMEKSRVAAYGDMQYVIEYLNPKDIVFFSHKWVGIIAAGEVIGPAKNDGRDEKYRDVKFLTPIPKREEGIIKKMSFGQVSQITGKSFFWARTIKVPYLSREEALHLLDELNKILG